MFTTALALLFLVKLFLKTNFYAPNVSRFGNNLFNRCHKLSYSRKQKREGVRIELTVDRTVNDTLTPSAGNPLNNFPSNFP